MFRAIPCLLLSGCCCCWPFGGGDGSGGYLEDYVEERIAEEVGEALLEHAIGAENVEVGPDGEVTITTADGTLQAREDEDGGLVITDGDGNVVLAGGDDASIPDDFPIRPYAGSTVATTMIMPEGQMVTWQVQGDVDQVLAHYRSEIEALGTVQQGMDMNTDDGRLVMLTVEASQVSMMLTADATGEVLVAITRVP